MKNGIPNYNEIIFTKEQKEEMSNKIKCLFSCMKKGNTCSIKTKC